MVKITTAEIVQENIKLIREGLKMPEERAKYGTSNIEQINKSTEEIIKLFVEKFGDGFQLTDMSVVISLWSPVKDIANSFKGAGKEFNDLTATETANLVEQFVDSGLRIAKIDLNNTGVRGINDIMYVFTKIADLYEEVATALEDGYQNEDLHKIGEVTSTAIEIIERLQGAILDVKDLNGKEYSQALRYLALRVHSILAKP